MTGRAKSEVPPRWAVLSLYRGGMLHVAAGLANSLAAADPAASLACFGPASMPSDLFDERVERHSFGLPEIVRGRELGRWMRVPVTANRLKRDLLAWRPSLIHCNSGHWLHPWLVPALAHRVPLVATLHDVTPHPGERRPHHGWKLNALLLHARRVIVHSEELRRQALATWPLSPEKVVALPLVSFGHCCRASPDLPTSPRPAHILLYGRIYAYKGYDVFFRAWPSILARVPDARITLAGAGDLSPWRAALSAAGGRVRVINRFIEEAEASQLFAEAALTVLPYKEASQSGVALLAAAHERAVVASRVGAIPEVVRDGETGLLVPPGDPDALADAVVALLLDPARCRRLGAYAKLWTEKQFGPAVLGNHLLKLYRDVLLELKAGTGGISAR